jgi:transposase
VITGRDQYINVGLMTCTQDSGFRSKLTATNYGSCQATLRRLEKAFQAFFRRVKAGEAPGYPRFKGRHWF